MNSLAINQETSSLEKLRSDVSATVGTEIFFSTPYAEVNAFQSTLKARSFAISVKNCVSMANNPKNLDAKISKDSAFSASCAAVANARPNS